MARKMKDSGIEWIGEIPEDWEVIALKNVCREFYSGGTPMASNSNYYTSSDNGFPFINISDLTNNKYVINVGKYITEEAAKSKSLKSVNNKYVLLAMYASTGTVSMMKIRSYISQAILAIRPDKNLQRHFLYYFLYSFKPYSNAFSRGTTQNNLNAEIIKNLKIPMIELKTQIKIASLLDKKTDQIEKIKSTITQQIETLEDYKKSVITEAVTKGLDKNVEMKDSGIEWIGEIPKHWEITYLKKFFYEGKNKNKFGQEKNLLSLSYGKIINKDINTQEGLLPKNFNNYNIVEKESIVIRPTDLQNDKRSLRTGYVNEKGIITSAYINLKPKKNINSKYFHYLLHSYDLIKVFYNMGSGVRQGLTYSEFSKLLVLNPNKIEQEQIVAYLDKKTATIDEVIAAKQKQLEILEEYKKSLIYEYVTGKKEVEDVGTI